MARSRRQGSVLLLVLVVVAMLTLGTATYLDLMQTERRAVRHHGRAAQARRLAESGVEYLKPFLAMSPQELLAEGGLTANPALMQAVLVDDQVEEVDRGRVTILAPNQADGMYSGVRYGLEDESAKLNVNVLLADGAEEQAASRLLALPGMNAEIADAILDWIDKDDEPRTNGAELDHYSELTPAYVPRNGPIADLDELLLVRGVTPELLYGLDQNRNSFVEPIEQPRGVLLDLDNSSGALNRGLSAYLTVYSVEGMRGPVGGPLVDLNGQDLQKLYNDLKKTLSDDQAKFIIVFRQYGPQPAADPSKGGATSPTGGSGGAGQPGQPAAAGAPVAGAATGGNAAATPPVGAASIELKFEQKGETEINSPLALVGVNVQIPGSGNNAPAQTVESPWRDDAGSYRELLEVYDMAALSGAQRVSGRVNVNAASRPVLSSIPKLPVTAINQIILRREAEPDPVLSDQRHSLWLLIEGLVKLDEMRAIERYITTRGDAFSGQAVGYFDAGPLAARGEFVLDRSGAQPRLRAWRDLTPLGRGYSPQLLGVAEPPTP